MYLRIQPQRVHLCKGLILGHETECKIAEGGSSDKRSVGRGQERWGLLSRQSDKHIGTAVKDVDYHYHYTKSFYHPQEPPQGESPRLTALWFPLQPHPSTR